MKFILLLIGFLGTLFWGQAQSVNRLEGDTVKIVKRSTGNTTAIVKGSLIIAPSGQSVWTFDNSSNLYVGNSNTPQIHFDAAGDAYFNQRVDAPALFAQQYLVIPTDTVKTCTVLQGNKNLINLLNGNFYFSQNNKYLFQGKN